MSNDDTTPPFNADDFADAFQKGVEASLTDDRLGGIRKAFDGMYDSFINDLYTNVRDQMGYWLVEHATRCANDAVEAMLDGNENKLRYYLQCTDKGYNPRENYAGYGGPLIHGKLSEYGGIGIRHKIVDAYPDLLKNERILDLEAQVEALTRQVIEAERRLDRGF